MPLDGDAVTSPRYKREPLLPSLHLIEVSHISISKSSITLRCFNMSCVSYETRCKYRNKLPIFQRKEEKIKLMGSFSKDIKGYREKNTC